MQVNCINQPVPKGTPLPDWFPKRQKNRKLDGATVSLPVNEVVPSLSMPPIGAFPPAIGRAPVGMPFPDRPPGGPGPFDSFPPYGGYPSRQNMPPHSSGPHGHAGMRIGEIIQRRPVDPHENRFPNMMIPNIGYLQRPPPIMINRLPGHPPPYRAPMSKEQFQEQYRRTHGFRGRSRSPHRSGFRDDRSPDYFRRSRSPPRRYSPRRSRSPGRRRSRSPGMRLPPRRSRSPKPRSRSPKTANSSKRSSASRSPHLQHTSSRPTAGNQNTAKKSPVSQNQELNQAPDMKKGENPPVVSGDSAKDLPPPANLVSDPMSATALVTEILDKSDVSEDDDGGDDGTIGTEEKEVIGNSEDPAQKKPGSRRHSKHKKKKRSSSHSKRKTSHKDKNTADSEAGRRRDKEERHSYTSRSEKRDGSSSRRS